MSGLGALPSTKAWGGQPIQDQPPLKVLPLADAVGHRALHDMTRVVPGHAKGAAVVHGDRIAAGDVCRLQQMGRANVYVADDLPERTGWVHENDAAEAFARVMAGSGVTFETPPKEGKINFTAVADGLLTIDEARLGGIQSGSERHVPLPARGIRW